jgi:glycosyltransferase involved in cell wall biosynthesis
MADPSGGADDLRALARYGIRPPFVASAGPIEPRKNLPALVAAFARVAGASPDLRLVLSGGDGWGAAQVRDAIGASGVATRVVRPGYIDDRALPALFRRAEAVAYPSHEEGFGMNALEALACGAPLITTQGSAIEEVVDGAALLVAPEDHAALEQALGRVLHDPALVADLRRAGPARARAFTWERSVGDHIAAYRSVAG